MVETMVPLTVPMIMSKTLASICHPELVEGSLSCSASFILLLEVYFRNRTLALFRVQLIHNSDDRVIDGHKPRFQQHRRLASAFVIHQLLGTSHPRGIARDNRLTLRMPLFVKRLK